MSTLENTLPKPKIELFSGKYFVACGFGGIIGRSGYFLRMTHSGASRERPYQLELLRVHSASVFL
jgi:hypothetical protein